MGKGDVYLKRWLSDRTRFANLINGTLFEGRKCVLPENLKREENEQSIVISRPNGEEIAVQKYRDITMVLDDGTRFVILACENQEEVHYAMPVRTMLYDALGYADQIREIRKKRLKEQKLDGSAEFLSGIKKGDLLIPIITVVFYYGEEKWDGSTDLYGLLGIECAEYDILKKYVPNYYINLIEPERIQDLSCFDMDLQMIFGMLKYRKDKKGLSEYVQKNREFFSKVDEETFQALMVMLGSKKRLQMVEAEVEKRDEGGFDVCQALEELYQDGVNEGMERGIEQGIEQGIKALIQDYMEEGFCREKILGKLEKHFSLSEEQAEKYMDQFGRGDGEYED